MNTQTVESTQIKPHSGLDPTLYDRDIYAWAKTNAQLMRERKFDLMDLNNLIEEIEDMAKTEQRALYSHLLNLLMHLLKWQFQPGFQGNSWRASIRNARVAINRLLEESPSLQGAPQNLLSKAYRDARKLATDETGLTLKTFSEICPYMIEQVLDEDWLPV